MVLTMLYQEHRQALNAKIDKVLETITEKLNCNEGK